MADRLDHIVVGSRNCYTFAGVTSSFAREAGSSGNSSTPACSQLQIGRASRATKVRLEQNLLRMGSMVQKVKFEFRAFIP